MGILWRTGGKKERKKKNQVVKWVKILKIPKQCSLLSPTRGEVPVGEP